MEKTVKWTITLEVDSTYIGDEELMKHDNEIRYPEILFVAITDTLEEAKRLFLKINAEWILSYVLKKEENMQHSCFGRFGHNYEKCLVNNICENDNNPESFYKDYEVTLNLGSYRKANDEIIEEFISYDITAKIETFVSNILVM